MRKYISLFIITVLLISAFFGIGGTALAAGENVTVSLDKDSVTASDGDTVNLTATINTDTDLQDYQVKCITNGQEYGEGGTLIPADHGTISIALSITSGMLDSNVEFQVQYKTASSTDWENGGTDTLIVNKKELSVKINASATANHTMAEPDDVIKFTFKIENQGEATLENIIITAPELNDGNALNAPFSLEAGSTAKEVTYDHTVKTALTVNPKVTFSANGETQPAFTTNSVEIELESPDVKPVLTVDNSSPDPGEEVTFTLTITNDGNVSYTDMKVTLNGEKMDFPTSKLNKGDSPSQTYKMSFDANEEVQFTITLVNYKGLTKSVHSNTINILLPVDSGELQQDIGLVIKVDRQELTSAGTVTFSGYASNDSEYELSDITVTESSIGEIYSASEMAANTKQSFSKTVNIDETTTYNFTLTAKDRNGLQYTVDYDPITVTILSSEVTPSDISDDAAQITQELEQSKGKSDPLLVWIIIAGVLIVLIIGVGVALIVLWRKGKSPTRPSAPRPRGVSKGKSSFKGKKVSKNRGYKDRNNF